MRQDNRAKALLSLAFSLFASLSFAAPSSDEIRHRETVIRVAREHRIDPALLMAVVKVESNFDAGARNPDGPVGLTQITPSTARAVQPGIRQSELLDPEHNLRVGARHLRQLLDQHKDPRMAVAAYQAGTGAVKSSGRQILKHPHTGSHVAKVMREYDQYRRNPAVQSEVGADSGNRKASGTTVRGGRTGTAVRQSGKSRGSAALPAKTAKRASQAMRPASPQRQSSTTAR